MKYKRGEIRRFGKCKFCDKPMFRKNNNKKLPFCSKSCQYFYRRTTLKITDIDEIMQKKQPPNYDEDTKSELQNTTRLKALGVSKIMTKLFPEKTPEQADNVKKEYYQKIRRRVIYWKNTNPLKYEEYLRKRRIYALKYHLKKKQKEQETKG